MRNFASALKDLLDLGAWLAGAGHTAPVVVFLMLFCRLLQTLIRAPMHYLLRFVRPWEGRDAAQFPMVGVDCCCVIVMDAVMLEFYVPLLVS